MNPKVHLSLSGRPFSEPLVTEFQSGVMSALQNLWAKGKDWKNNKKGTGGFYDKAIIRNVAKIVKKGIVKIVGDLGDVTMEVKFAGKKGWTFVCKVNPSFDEVDDFLKLFTVTSIYTPTSGVLNKIPGVKGMAGYKVKCNASVFKWIWEGEGEDRDIKIKVAKTLKKEFKTKNDFMELFDDWMNQVASMVKKQVVRANAEYDKSKMAGESEGEAAKNKAATLAKSDPQKVADMLRSWI